MSSTPEPLPSGFVLAERFEILQVLGRGGFGIVYLAVDQKLEDEVVLKELAPAGTMRSEEGVLALEAHGGQQAHHLRQRFLEEAKLLSRIAMRGLPTMRAAFGENGTAYYAIEHIPGATTLEDLLRRETRLDAAGATDILYQLLEILEVLHSKGFLHRDIKPSNILVAPNGEITLIDFGAAREWHADATVHHTVLFTPGYAPLEQLSPRGRRGPATDIYAVCATAYHMLTGAPPEDAAERAHGSALIPLRDYRPEVDSALASALEAGLSQRYEDRPQSVAEFRQLLAQGPILGAEPTLAQLDEMLVQLKRFNFDRRACPACGGVLEEPKPLKQHGCPVCRRGTIRTRDLDERLCPVCRSSVLKSVSNAGPLAFCPLCRVGELTGKRVSFLDAKRIYTCSACDAKFDAIPGGMALLSAPDQWADQRGADKTFEEWRKFSGRSAEVWQCDGCHAQFDTLADGRRQQVVPTEDARALYPEEWARVAARLKTNAGNALCDHCQAEFDVDGEHVSPVSAHEDPFAFGKRYLGRLLNWEDLRWLGVGKESPTPGLVCNDCDTELDRDGDFLRLVRTENPKLIRHVDEPRTSEDWHRLARGLPAIHEEQAFLNQMDDAVHRAYLKGEIGFGGGGQFLWNGQATRADGQTANLAVREDEIMFGGLLRKWRTPLDAVMTAYAEGDTLILQLSGSREPVEFDVEPMELTAALQSGKRTVELRAGELAKRIEALRTR
ncbi:MAG: hypothetical protein QOJ65_1929 [Fimbriimonadaceae bacterium]|jgi:serine/threonine protein kinase|nr:hypothetical protein [Fimbriimonadaceae bacterium]